MLIPVDWLKEYIKTDLSPEVIADKLTMAGLNIEEIKNDVLNAEVTTNRSDWLSLYGVARELSALTNGNLNDIPPTNLTIGQNNQIKVEVDSSLVLRYTGHLIKGIKVAESPEWLKNKLKRVNIRSINNVVDVTNYIMYAYGIPLHAFDADKIVGGELKIRPAGPGEEIVTLDDMSRSVNKNNLVAENNNRLIDLVGIMGGKLSETDLATTNIFLQGAIFPSAFIRRSSKNVRLTTEASYRYERGVDYILSKKYLDLASSLILELCGGQIDQEIDIYPHKRQLPEVQWTPSAAQSLLGIPVDENKSIPLLKKLGITTQKNNDKFVSTSPSWRFDINIPPDIYEEIARLQSVNDFSRTALESQKVDNTSTPYYFVEYIKDILSDLGFTEADGYSFISDKDLTVNKLKPGDCFEVANPLSDEYKYLRPNLQIGLLKSVAQNPSFDTVAFFEIGHVFPNPSEQVHLGIIMAGKESVNLKDILKNFFACLNMTDFNPEIQPINLDILSSHKIRKNQVTYFEIPISSLQKKVQQQPISLKVPTLNQKYQPISKYPSVRRDIAIIIDSSIDLEDVKQTINDTDNRVKNVELFDKFENPKFGPNKMSVAYHIYYQSDEKTLTDGEAETLHQEVTNRLQEKFNAVPRV